MLISSWKIEWTNITRQKNGKSIMCCESYVHWMDDRLTDVSTLAIANRPGRKTATKDIDYSFESTPVTGDMRFIALFIVPTTNCWSKCDHHRDALLFIQFNALSIWIIAIFYEIKIMGLLNNLLSMVGKMCEKTWGSSCVRNILPEIPLGRISPRGVTSSYLIPFFFDRSKKFHCSLKH